MKIREKLDEIENDVGYALDGVKDVLKELELLDNDNDNDIIDLSGQIAGLESIIDTLSDLAKELY